jgi:autotransporter-associated beta strand protein
VTLTGNSRTQSDAGTLVFSNTVALGANTLNVGGTGNTSIAGAIGGTGGLTKDGSGTLSLSGSNTFGGNITVSGGTVQLGANNVIPNTASVSLAAGTALDLNGKTDTFTGLSGTGTLLMNGGNLTLLGSNTFNGSISGAGTLNITNDVIPTGGILTLGGILNNPALTINLDGTLNLGSFVNTVGTINLTGNSILDFGNTSATVLNLQNLNLNGFTLTINNWVDTVDYFTAQNWTGATFNTRGSAPMNQVTFTGFSNNQTAWQSWDRQITPTPEPATYGMIFMGLSLGGLGFRRWKMRAGRTAAK